jgi:hypothetical protein
MTNLEAHQKREGLTCRIFGHTTQPAGEGRVICTRCLTFMPEGEA